MRHRLKDAKRFQRGRDHAIRLEYEPRNPYDANAITVIGISRGWLFRSSRNIGYVPADVAATIVGGRHLEHQPRLRNVWRGGFIRAAIVILAPKQVVKATRKPQAAKRTIADSPEL